jgi:formylglycine-generating enzyme required for sulfatase activity
MTSPAAADGMVTVPAGDFWMGAEDEEPDERPRHLVYLDAYAIDRYEVTNARFARFVDAGGYRTEGLWSADGWRWVQRNRITSPLRWNDPAFNGPTQPVVGVAWYEAEAFCRFEGHRLPTEAEWEKAARGADERRFPWGDAFEAGRAQGPSAGGTAPVGSHPDGASPFGVEDMAGNAWEWVADWYDAGYYAASAPQNPTGADTGSEKVLRGGSWFTSDPGKLRTTDRDMITVNPGFPLRFPFIGFRCARDAG